MRRVELLAPARTADIGIEAFRHGADAVYIGAEAFGARVAAGNSVADIERLAAFGHRFGGRTYVALNTILTDAELPEAERLAWRLYEAGVDAFIVQDLGLLGLDLPPIELHASTQTDNRTADKVALMHRLGMKRVVLARELSVADIRAIHTACPEVELECFVHGALCVCLSGQCYLSAALTGRSANRGACAQPCRLPMDLIDARGRTLARQRHLLSLRDMNRSRHLEAMAEAGVYSLKIEGRLKDMSYVKNVTAAYRRLIDQAEGLAPASLGRVTYTFVPDVRKSFNRGFTPHYIDGQRRPDWNFDTPKSVGEPVGSVAAVGRDWFTLAPGSAELHNGDGLVVGATGFRLNRYDVPSGRCYPLGGEMVCRGLRTGQAVWRNLDVAFERLLSRPSAARRIPVKMRLVMSTAEVHLHASVCADGLAFGPGGDEGSTVGPTAASAPAPCLSGRVPGHPGAEASLGAALLLEAEASLSGTFAPAQTPQGPQVQQQLARLGDTDFVLEGEVQMEGEVFVPGSMLAQLRREVCRLLSDRIAALADSRRQRQADEQAGREVSVAASDRLRGAQLGAGLAPDVLPVDYRANVLNRQARALYARLGLGDVEPAFEAKPPRQATVMQTRHCLKYAFGQCPRFTNPHPQKLPAGIDKWTEPMALQIGKRKFILNFGCKNDCISKIKIIFAPKKDDAFGIGNSIDM